jgi:hypothetical protein
MFFGFAPIINFGYPRCDAYINDLIEMHRKANDAMIVKALADHSTKTLRNQNYISKKVFKTPRPSRKNTYVGNKSPR